MTRSRPLLPLLLLLGLTACRDFQIAEAFLSVEVSPAQARQGALVTVTVSGSALGTSDPEVRLLGQLLTRTADSPSSAPAFGYTVTGAEPEGVDLAVDVTAGSLARSAKIRFDFTPPQVVSATSRPNTAPLGTQVAIELVSSEPLGAPPELNDRGHLATCAADATDPRLFHCSLTASELDQPGWQTAKATLVDLAGNQQVVTALPLGVVFDYQQALGVVAPSVEPAVASRGTALAISFGTTRRLSEAPSVRVGGRDALLDSEAGADGVWRFHYAVAGTELGPEPAQAPVKVAARIGGVEFDLKEVLFDFRAPQPLSLSASRARVGTPASDTNDVTVDLACDEPLSGLQASVQARPLTCAKPKADDATAWRCSYSADGTELEGPQKLVLWLSDAVGNSERVTTAELFSFDFSAHLDAQRLFVVSRFGERWSFAADPGAAEPGAKVAVRLLGQAQPAFSTGVQADGSVAEVGDLGPGDTQPQVEVQETDLAGNVSGWVRPRVRFVADPSHKPDDGITDTWTWLGGTDVPELLEFAEGPGPDKPSPAALASADGTLVTVKAPQVDPPTWIKPVNAGGLTPWTSPQQPLAYVPGAGVLHTELSDTGFSGAAWFWDGERWSFLQVTDSYPHFSSAGTYGVTVDPVTQRFHIFGPNDTEAFTWIARFSSRVGGGASTPELRFTPVTLGLVPATRSFASAAFDRASRTSVLFGGWTWDYFVQAEHYHLDTWLFDGSTWCWARRSPSPRAAGARPWPTTARAAGRSCTAASRRTSPPATLKASATATAACSATPGSGRGWTGSGGASPARVPGRSTPWPGTRSNARSCSKAVGTGWTTTTSSGRPSTSSGRSTRRAGASSSPPPPGRRFRRRACATTSAAATWCSTAGSSTTPARTSTCGS
ncbi:MAG TPA: hypothetical protein VGK67_00740 [Myxococcales bacterium]|jgi:hypothetical protein